MGTFSTSLTWQPKHKLVEGGPLWILFVGRGGAASKNLLTINIMTTTPMTAITLKKLMLE